MVRPFAVFATIAGVFVSSPLAHAQEDTPDAFRKEAVASGVLMQPLGDLRGSIETIGYDGGFHYLTALGRGTVSVGVDSQLLFYASEPGARNDDMILTAHGLIRLRRRSAPRRPYAEALAGIKGFSVTDAFPPRATAWGAACSFPSAVAAKARTSGG
jgi:hypothetical protein